MLTRTNICFSLFFIACLFLYRDIGYAQVIPDTSLNEPIPAKALAQADTIQMYADTVTVKVKPPLPWEPKPKRAGLYSAIIPGLGQIYNKQYWKAPIVYAALGAGAYFIQDNLKQYRKFRKAYISRIDNDPSTTDKGENTENLDPQSLQQIQNDYRKQAELTVLLTGVGYILQIMDAVASAHLRNFDISRDISMHMSPMLFSNGIGVGIVLHLK